MLGRDPPSPVRVVNQSEKLAIVSLMNFQDNDVNSEHLLVVTQSRYEIHVCTKASFDSLFYIFFMESKIGRKKNAKIGKNQMPKNLRVPPPGLSI